MKDLKLKAYSLGFQMPEKIPIEFDVLYLISLKIWLKNEHKILVETNYNFTGDKDHLGYTAAIITNYKCNLALRWNCPDSCCEIHKTEFEALKTGIFNALNYLL